MLLVRLEIAVPGLATMRCLFALLVFFSIVTATAAFAQPSGGQPVVVVIATPTGTSVRVLLDSTTCPVGTVATPTVNGLDRAVDPSISALVCFTDMNGEMKVVGYRMNGWYDSEDGVPERFLELLRSGKAYWCKQNGSNRFSCAQQYIRLPATPPRVVRFTDWPTAERFIASFDPSRGNPVSGPNAATIVAADIRTLLTDALMDSTEISLARKSGYVRRSGQLITMTLPGNPRHYRADVQNVRCTPIKAGLQCNYEAQLFVRQDTILFSLPEFGSGWFPRKDVFVRGTKGWTSASLYRDFIKFGANGGARTGAADPRAQMEAAEREREWQDCRNRPLQSLASGDRSMATAQSLFLGCPLP